ncbi:enamine deaminase RidA [Sulfitobacter alexandrii]|uniref:Enamine deaminase RidA n=1 Tax=Sulfitobacter alexandrii TaxID=1917485 RepID=A0A1J0WII0_9RHOB|nr:RidA family protein [Sulfitobacter alexandrii]APE44124.1 enamine deaminase RidA [Sulfitobacter alexandrii]
MQSLTPSEMPPPFANYAHGVAIPAGHRLVQTSGQLGITAQGAIPESAEAQATLCFDHIRRVLALAGMGPSDVAHIIAYVTDRAHMAGYMQARDAFVGTTSTPPASTLLIVSGFTRPEFKVEVEVLAAAPA